MLEFFGKLFSNDFMPHKACFLSDSAVVWLHVVSDCLIAVAYYLIPVLLFRFAAQRRDIRFKWIFLAFGMFILACGSTHLLAAVTVFNPVYRLEGMVKAITAAASIFTVALLIPFMPTLIALPSPSQLSQANRALAAEVAERRLAEEEVRKANEELEQRVARRTESLEQALSDLQREMDRRRELEDQLVHSQKMEAVGRLAGGVAHDFNNLLTIITGYTDMLSGHVEGNPVAVECVREVREAAERATALTNQLLAFSRRQVAVPRVVHLNKGIRRLEKMLRRIIGEDIELQMSLAGDLAPARVDPSQMDQVLMNLAVNSRDAMPHGGRLTVETANVRLHDEYAAAHVGVQPGPYVMVAVGDTGTGMDESTKARIFEPFFTTKEQGKGTGLGLSIVYGIVKQNGGGIEVDSEPGQGTLFKIYLPAVAAVPEICSPETAAPEAEAGRETILLVEDDDRLRRLALVMLEQQGYRVLEAGSPFDALRMIREQHGAVDLLLADMIMPQMTGVDLAAQIRTEYPQIKVLFMSGYTERSVMNQGTLTPETPFLRKPFTSAELADRIREVLRGSRGPGH